MPHLHGQREKEDQGGGRGKITGKLLRLTVKFSWGGCRAVSAGREGKHDGGWGAWHLFGNVAFGLLSASGFYLQQLRGSLLPSARLGSERRNIKISAAKFHPFGDRTDDVAWRIRCDV